MAYASQYRPKPFDTMLRRDLETVIEQANLGCENTEIAKRYLIDHALHVDIAVELGYSRSTITKRIHHIVRQIEKAAAQLSFT